MFYWGKTMINIQDIIPFMKKGYVAMDKDGYWYHHEEMPYIMRGNEYWSNNGSIDGLSDIFPIKKARNWTQSLIKVGGNDERNC